MSKTKRNRFDEGRVTKKLAGTKRKRNAVKNEQTADKHPHRIYLEDFTD